jgi:thymidylate synthase
MKNRFEKDYKKLIKNIVTTGTLLKNRTGVDALSLFNQNITIDLDDGFPIVTSRKIFFKKALAEYVWIKEGLCTTSYLHQKGVKWWDEYADEKGYLGKTYGYQLRSFNGEIDQLDYIHRNIRLNSRQLHVTFWNPSELNQVKLPPCYTGMTFMVENNKLNMSFQMRSSDVMLGLPYDIIVMAMFLIEVAEFNELKPNKLGIQITNAHIYKNHLEQVKEYFNRRSYILPTLCKGTSGYFLKKYTYRDHIELPLNN